MQRKKALTFKFGVPSGGADLASHGLSLHGVEFNYQGTFEVPKKRKQAQEVGGPLRLRVSKSVRISGKSRCVLLGKNGSGKSTFLNLCSGKLQPTAGAVDRTQDIKIGHYSQLSEELFEYEEDSAAMYLVKQSPEALASHLGSTKASRLVSALEAKKKQQQPGAMLEDGVAKNRAEKAAAKAQKTIAVQEKRLMEVARAVLSNFGLEGDLATTVPIKHLSGGQKACLKFAKLSLEPAHILLLDEPTNHLDAEACEALIRGLSEFKGGIVAVTHDEHLIYRLIHCNWSASELLICRD